MKRSQRRGLQGPRDLWGAARSTSGTADALIGGKSNPLIVQDGTILEVDGVSVRVTGFAKRGDQVAILAIVADATGSSSETAQAVGG